MILQNPVSSLAFLLASLQLLIPLGSLTMVTSRFCESLLRNKVFTVIATIFTIIAEVAVLVRPNQNINFFHLYDFPQSFRFQGFAAGTITTLTHFLLLFGVRTVSQQIFTGTVQPS